MFYKVKVDYVKSIFQLITNIKLIQLALGFVCCFKRRGVSTCRLRHTCRYALRHTFFNLNKKIQNYIFSFVKYYIYIHIFFME